MDGSVSKHGWQCFGVSGGVSRKCFEVDGSVSVFRNSVSKWMAVFRNGWQCFGVSGGVSRKCFEVDGSVSVFPNGVSKWMAVFPDFILSSTTASAARYTLLGARRPPPRGHP